MTVALAALASALAGAELRVALLDRCRPRGLASERERLVAAWEAGRELAPRYELAPSPELESLERRLEELAAVLAGAGPWGALHAARAHELALEAAIAARPGTPRARAAAAARFPSPTGPAGERAACLADAWVRAALRGRDEPTVCSDDERSPTSLVAALRAEIGRRRLPVRVEVSRDLASTVGVGERVVRVRAGVALGAGDVARLLAHELEGHLLPRLRAHAEPLGLFRVGTAGGGDDEEGRAVALEAATPGFDGRRRRELALRHLGALALRGGASFVELGRRLRGLGATAREAVELALRLDRGAALGREIVYLPALVRYETARRSAPDPEPWLRRGRIAIGAVPLLAALGPPPPHLELGRGVALEAVGA